MSDVVFVQMPFAGVERPSLALGLFTSALRGAGIPTESVYANISFAERIGLAPYTLLRAAAPSSLIGEWLFGESAFGAAARGIDGLPRPSLHFDVEDEFIDYVVRYRGHPSLEELLLDLRRQASEFVEEVAAEVLRARPKAVACTSMFDQHVASLSVLQRVKALAPEVFTVIGGANCAGPMGLATHRSFPAVDFTVTGEFDQFVVQFFTALVGAAGDAARVGALPPNVLGPAHRVGEAPALPPAAVLLDMNSAAVPDYDDYFEQLYSSPISPYVLASIPLETSRGCWWGAKQHCTFCGLNAEGMAFRKKAPARALEEIRSLTSRHGVYRFAAADNIIDMSYFDEVLKELSGDGRDYNFFYETKANLKREQVQVMADAGCNFIQPGIESLHDETLKIMRKGITACGNVQLLKYCVEFGVTPAWSILCGFPGSDPSWVAEVAEELPWMFHLPPPSGTTPIRIDRFSPYHQRPADYGLELEVLPAYRLVYPFDDAVLHDLAYFFRQKGGITQREAETARASRDVSARWRDEFWSPRRAELTIESDDGQAIRVRDTRECGISPAHELTGTLAALLRALATPASPAAVAGRLAAANGQRPSEAEVEDGLAMLRALRLVWRSSTQLVALPTARPLRPMPEKADAAVGKVDMAKYLVEKARFRRAVA
jgi:magnesium-protoporphyrin IX monomethyl ester (oxidative) cyclase